jgi:hypothetical protein
MAKPPPIVGRSAIGVAFSEGARNWPFVFGFGVTLGLVFKLTTGLDRKHAFISSSLISPHLLCFRILVIVGISLYLCKLGRTACRRDV